MNLGTTARLGWRNLGRNPRRTGIALSVIALAQFSVLAMDGLINGYVDAMKQAVTGPFLGHAQLHAPDWREERATDLAIDDLDRRLATLRSDPEVTRATARIYASVLAALGEEGHMVVVVGVDVEAERVRHGLLDGVSDAQAPRGRHVLLGAALARTLQAKPGDEIAVVGQGADGSLANDLFTVGGTIATTVDIVHRTGVVMSLDAAQELLVMPDQAHEISVQGTQLEQARGLAARLGAAAPFQGLEVLAWEDIAPELVTILEMSDLSTLIILFLVFIAAAAGIANTMLMATFERSREIGMLLAIGTSPARLVRMIATEAVVLGVIGVTLGSVLGVALVEALPDGFSWGALGAKEVEDLAFKGLNYSAQIVPRVAPRTVLYGFTAVVLTSLVSALWPAGYAARLDPVKVMRS